jgi:hypothetical protein
VPARSGPGGPVAYREYIRSNRRGHGVQVVIESLAVPLRPSLCRPSRGPNLRRHTLVCFFLVESIVELGACRDYRFVLIGALAPI